MSGYAFLLPFLPSLALAGTLQVEIRDSEVWLIGDEAESQVTHDGKQKYHAKLSASGRHIAYMEGCDLQQNCATLIVVIDREGSRVRSFQPSGKCSMLSMTWTGEETIATVCHINPSLNKFIETDISTGRKTRELLGYDFTPSPDGNLVAHVGWIVHFAPPYAQSNYLQVEHTTIYPLPQGMNPVEQTGLTEPPTVVHKDGFTYRGIHEFLPGLYWSPDSRRIALIDCTYDWTPNTPGSLSRGDGEESERRYHLAVVSTDGRYVLFPLAAVPGDLRNARLSWTSSRSLSVDINGWRRTFAVR